LQSAATIHVPYDGIVKELMYEVGEIATLGVPLIMVEVEGSAEGDSGGCGKRCGQM